MTDRGHTDKSILTPVAMLMAYYGAIAILLLALVRVFPGFVEHLPVGGAQELSTRLDGNRLEAVGSVIEGDGSVLHGSIHLLLSIVSAFLLMLPITWIYMGSRRRKEISQAFVNTILLLPIAITGIVYIVQNSLALAFSLAGIVAGVRFRHTLKDTGDTTYLFTAILVGLAAGIGAVDVAAIVSIAFNFTILILWQTGYASEATGKQSFSRHWMTRKEVSDDEEDEEPEAGKEAG